MTEQILIVSSVGRQRYSEYLAAKAPSCLRHVLTWLTAFASFIAHDEVRFPHSRINSQSLMRVNHSLIGHR